VLLLTGEFCLLGFLPAAEGENDSAGVEVILWVTECLTPCGHLPFLLGEESPQERPALLRLRCSGKSPERVSEGGWQATFTLFFTLPAGRSLQGVVVAPPGSNERLTGCDFVELPVLNEDGTWQVPVVIGWPPATVPFGWHRIFLVDRQGMGSETRWVRLESDEEVGWSEPESSQTDGLVWDAWNPPLPGRFQAGQGWWLPDGKVLVLGDDSGTRWWGGGVVR
jgi:hypothetical protein